MLLDIWGAEIVLFKIKIIFAYWAKFNHALFRYAVFCKAHHFYEDCTDNNWQGHYVRLLAS